MLKYVVQLPRRTQVLSRKFWHFWLVCCVIDEREIQKIYIIIQTVFTLSYLILKNNVIRSVIYLDHELVKWWKSLALRELDIGFSGFVSFSHVESIIQLIVIIQKKNNCLKLRQRHFNIKKPNTHKCMDTHIHTKQNKTKDTN